MQRTVDFKTLLGLQVNFLQAKYPRGHPKVGELIPDYSGTAKVTEEEQTTYYDGVAGASLLPKDDVNISEGIGKIAIDSVSDEFSNNEGMNGWPRDASIKVELTDYGFEDSIDVKQWVTNSGVDLGGPNDAQMPDWLEKAVWDKVNEYKSQFGIVGTVFNNINKVKLAEKDKALILAGAECGRTPEIESEVHTIYIADTCEIENPNKNMHRKNARKRIKTTTLIQARLAWQAAQRFTTPDNATGANPKNDSDGDGCPEVILVADETEADIHDATPIQDGAPPTQVPENSTERNPDNIANNTMHNEYPYLGWSTIRVSKCHYLLKTDAIQFMQDHN